MVSSTENKENMAHRIDPLQLGATMYVPVIHPQLAQVIAGKRYPTLRSVVLCLEDALHDNDVSLGLERLRTLLVTRDITDNGPLVFVRPRDLEMALHIATFKGITTVDGFVVPKLAADSLPDWVAIARDLDIVLMPTLESAWIFDALALSHFAQTLTEAADDRVLALRVGGNDLLSHLGLRRVRGQTLYDGPLAGCLSQLMCSLSGRGFALTAPVFDITDDPDTLALECQRDVDFGFVGKTAIHPNQIDIIQRCFTVPHASFIDAQRVLDSSAPAVFKRGGAMLEPATHRTWATRTLARAAIYGCRPERE
ncbi:MAG: HpcH/HpaI aldolase/citrate lyase family protein [Granulosicoccus sp.]